MKSISKLIYFFSNKYYNNLKFNNKLVSTTRIFFERTTKTSHSLQALGNVYRNSKWTDLNIFNIKESSLAQFKNIFTIVVILLLLLVLSLRFDLQWSNTVLYSIIEFLTYLKDLIFSWILSIFYTLSLIFLRLIHFFSKSVLTEIIPEVQKKANYTNTQIKLTSHNVLTNGAFSDSKSNLLLSSLYLQKVTKYLHLVSMSDANITAINTNSNFLNLYQTFQNKLINLNYMLFFMNKSRFNITPVNSSPFLNKEVLFYECLDGNQLTKTNYHLLDINALKSLPFTIQNEFKNVIKQNLNLGKENKWLMKNTLLSYDIITKNLSTTHVKKLYGNFQFNSNGSNVNIWASNRLGQSTNFSQLNSSKGNQDLNLLTSNLLSNSSLHYLDNLEESFFWVVKRFKFLQSTSTYYQFNSSYNPSVVLPRNSVKENTFALFKNIMTVNVSPLGSYNSHFIDLSSSITISNHTNLAQTQLDFSSPKTFTEFDLNFSKYFLNNLALQKNKILIYSNLN